MAKRSKMFQSGYDAYGIAKSDPFSQNLTLREILRQEMAEWNQKHFSKFDKWEKEFCDGWYAAEKNQHTA